MRKFYILSFVLTGIASFALPTAPIPLFGSPKNNGSGFISSTVPLPQPVIFSNGNSHTVCKDYSTGNVLRQVALTAMADGASSYQWYRNGVAINSSASSTYYASLPGDYTVVAIDPAFDNSVPSNVYTVIQSGPATFIGQGYEVNGNDITITVAGYGQYQYALSPNGPWQDSNVFENQAGTDATFFVQDVTPGSPCDMAILEYLATTAFAGGHFEYYPNPVAEILTLKNEGAAIAGLEVYNTLGQKVLQQQYDSTQVQANLSELQSGIYMVKVRAANAVQTIKIVKN